MADEDHEQGSESQQSKISSPVGRIEIKDQQHSNENWSEQRCPPLVQQDQRQDEHADRLPQQAALPLASVREVPISTNAPLATSTAKPNGSDNCSSTTTRGRRRLVFDSPRIRYSDAILFPAASLSHRERSLLQQQQQRQLQQQQQGHFLNAAAAAATTNNNHPLFHHGPPPQILSLGRRRSLTLETLMAGMPKLAAMRVLELHLHFMQGDVVDWKTCEWQAWWMGIAKLFQNVRHLYIERAAVNDHVDDEEVDEDNGPANLKVKARRRRTFPWLKAVTAAFDDAPCTLEQQQEEEPYYRNTRSERLEVLLFLPHLVSFNGTQFTPDDYKTVQSYHHSVDLFVPFVPKIRAETPVLLPTHTCSLLDQEMLLADDEEYDDDCDDDDDLDLEMEAIREILEATKSLNDEDFVHDCSMNVKRPRTPNEPMEEKKEEDGDDSATLPRTPPRCQTQQQYAVELDYVSPETNAVACEWGVACGSLALPSYFSNTNATSSGPCTRLRFRPRASLAAPAAAKDAMKARRSMGSLASHVTRVATVSNALQAQHHVESISNKESGVDFNEGSVPRPIAPVSTPTETNSIDNQQTLIADANDAVANCPDTMSDLDSNRLPAHAYASLSSPFPMQFRARAKQAIFAAKHKTRRNVPIATPTPVSLATISDETLRKPIPFPSSKTSSLGCDKHIPVKQSTPPKPAAKLPAKSSRPPPCPRRPSPTMAPAAFKKQKAKKHRGPKWREKVAARSSSIMDESEEEEEEEDDDDDCDTSDGGDIAQGELV